MTSSAIRWEFHVNWFRRLSMGAQNVTMLALGGVIAIAGTLVGHALKG